MYFALSIRILMCIGIAVAFAYSYINKQNELIAVRLMIPLATKELKVIQEENIRLRYQADCFLCPSNLMEIANKPEFSHLKFPGRNGEPDIDKYNFSPLSH